MYDVVCDDDDESVRQFSDAATHLAIRLSTHRFSIRSALPRAYIVVHQHTSASAVATLIKSPASSPASLTKVGQHPYHNALGDIVMLPLCCHMVSAGASARTNPPQSMSSSRDRIGANRSYYRRRDDSMRRSASRICQALRSFSCREVQHCAAVLPSRGVPWHV